jgi:acyl phosphate:glycerol-3-phosphate acyltransferase|tara:strand:+ start:720 stop:1301 length:582 start_codon:yes stop_codon:yes gene_type:complete
VSIEILYVSFYSYFLGSIPFGLVLTKLFLDKDLRNVGSGNIGATNVLRTGKKSLGALTLFLDGLKSYIVIIITYKYFADYIYLSALLCFLGHIFPVWLKFKGGKGIAVFLGILFALSINYGIIFIVCWSIILYLMKYSSVSSLMSIGIIFFYSIYLNNSSQSVFFFIIFTIAIYTHRENIVRLKNKTENKINL